MNRVRYTTGPVTGPVTFGLDAGGTALLAEIAAGPDAEMATAELSGPTETTDAARISMSGRTWTLALPRTRPAGPTVITAGRRVSIISGTVTGSVCMIGGRILAGGIDVTATSGPTAEPARLAVRLPAGSSLTARAAAGQVTTRGELAHIDITSTAADVGIDLAGTLGARTVSGDIRAATIDATARLHTTSGDIRVDAAAGPVTAETVSGDITCCVTGTVTVDASSVSGDIDITATRGVRPDVRARSVSGRVRTH